MGGGSYPLCRGAVSVFYSPSRLGNTELNVKIYFILDNSVSHEYSLDVKTVLFRAIQFRISTQFKCQNSSINNLA